MIVFAEVSNETSMVHVRIAEGGVPENTFQSYIYTDNGHPILIFWLTGKPQSDEIMARAEQDIVNFVKQKMALYWKAVRLPRVPKPRPD